MSRPDRVSEFEGRGLHALSLTSFEDWPRSFESAGPFVLFVAADARDVSDESIMEAARRAIGSGCCSVVAWGPECERVHDLFDRVIVDEHFQGTETDENVIMTTWHTRDSFEHALRYFLVCATPASAYEPTCRTWLAVAIGSDAWAAQLVAALRDPEAFMAPWLDEDEDDPE